MTLAAAQSRIAGYIARGKSDRDAMREQYPEIAELVDMVTQATGERPPYVEVNGKSWGRRSPDPVYPPVLTVSMFNEALRRGMIPMQTQIVRRTKSVMEAAIDSEQ